MRHLDVVEIAPGSEPRLL